MSVCGGNHWNCSGREVIALSCCDCECVVVSVVAVVRVQFLFFSHEGVVVASRAMAAEWRRECLLEAVWQKRKRGNLVALQFQPGEILS